MTVTTLEISASSALKTTGSGLLLLEFAPVQVQSKRIAAAKWERVCAQGYTLGVVLLMMASSAECFYRLVWAMQP